MRMMDLRRRAEGARARFDCWDFEARLQAGDESGEQRADERVAGATISRPGPGSASYSGCSDTHASRTVFRASQFPPLHWYHSRSLRLCTQAFSGICLPSVAE
jgi:hypothetical protein